MSVKNTAKRTGSWVVKEVIRTPGHIIGTTWMRWAGQACTRSAQRITQSIRTDMHQADDEEFQARMDQFQGELAATSREDYQKQMLAWKISSRLYYCFSLLLLAITFVMIFTGYGGAWTLVDGSALAALLFTRGLRHAYRYWQMQTRTFFVQGAFRQWWQQGVWLV